MSATDYVLLMLLALLLLAFLVHIMWRRAALKAGREAFELYTIVRCENGTRRRRYQEGDFVGKPTPECANGVIVGIFKEVPPGSASERIETSVRRLAPRGRTAARG